MMMICPLFSSEKIDDARLLAHLKNIRAEVAFIIDSNLADRESGLSQVSQKERAQYRFAWKFFDEFYSKADVLQKIITDEIARPEFAVICDNISLSFTEIQNKFDNLSTYQKMSTLIPVEGGLRAQDPIEISEQVKQELFELFVPIFKKLYQEACEQNNDEIFGEKLTDSLIRKSFDEILDVLIWYPETLMYDWPIIKLLDAKIAELEA